MATMADSNTPTVATAPRQLIPVYKHSQQFRYQLRSGVAGNEVAVAVSPVVVAVVFIVVGGGGLVVFVKLSVFQKKWHARRNSTKIYQSRKFIYLE